MTSHSVVAHADDQCSFSLSGPTVIETSYGVEVVSATLTPGACPHGWAITKVMVCVAAAGTSGRCKTEPGPDVSQVLLEYVPRGGTYVVTGRGCSYGGDPVTSRCVEFGPLEAQL
ncbi:hypothetical protein ABQE57_00840 [Mycolicibacterium elephantis]|uniref:hypothetical protein n=1 Tax=Mycolicibacterium elephantis TaxID=81858 RepID=UPI0007E96C60|nr:hypothetical protein [Mycolicibacterium elephantis]OBB16358.1 hypothetical protein A5762_03685 [Mycolicibacterium elephantis]OBE95302.1 hypothetical protein A5776_02125 [Mycolicibacterium elephantis]